MLIVFCRFYVLWWSGLYCHSPNSACTEGFWRILYRDWVECCGALRVVRAASFLLLFHILRACHLRHSAAKCSVAPLSTENRIHNQLVWSQMLLAPSWAYIWHLEDDTLMMSGWYSDQMSQKIIKKCDFFKMSMSPNSKNVYFSETKAPQGTSRQIGAFQNQKMKI